MKFDKTKVLLGIGVTALGLASTLLNGKKSEYERQEMEKEITKKVLKELQKPTE